MRQAKRQLAGSGEALPVGVIGEVVNLTSRTISATNMQYTAGGSSFALKKGVWLILGYITTDGITPSSTVAAAFSNNNNNDPGSPSGGVSTLTVVHCSAAEVVYGPMVAFVYTTAADDVPIYPKARVSGADTSVAVSISGTAIRIA